MLKVIIDRPLGSYHPNYPKLYYPINYGYIEGIIAGDKKEQDAYIMGVEVPLQEFIGEVIAIIHRFDDTEDKWVVASKGKRYTTKEIEEAVFFQEQYFKTTIEILKPLD